VVSVLLGIIGIIVFTLVICLIVWLVSRLFRKENYSFFDALFVCSLAMLVTLMSYLIIYFQYGYGFIIFFVAIIILFYLYYFKSIKKMFHYIDLLLIGYLILEFISNVLRLINPSWITFASLKLVTDFSHNSFVGLLGFILFLIIDYLLLPATIISYVLKKKFSKVLLYIYISESILLTLILTVSGFGFASLLALNLFFLVYLIIKKRLNNLD
jgi:hypothetical protein